MTSVIDRTWMLDSVTPPRFEDPEHGHEVVVRVLGPVDVLGGARPFARAWSLELVAYLAMHPRGASSDTWSTALWPDRVPAGPTRHATASDARRALGRSTDGCDHLPSSKGRLALARTVITDWALFRDLASRDGPTASDGWRAALDLVRGPLFDGLRAADWTVLEGVHAQIEDAVVRVALCLAEYELDRSDGWAAESAARRALLVSPYDERLYRVLMRASERQGNYGAVDAVMGDLVRLLSGSSSGRRPRGCADPAFLAPWVHPETLELYCALRLRQSSSHPARRPRNGCRTSWNEVRW